MKTHLGILLFACCLTTTALAFDPFDGQTVIRSPGGPTDGSAGDPIVQQSIGDVNSIQDNSAVNDTRGRREKIQDDAIPKGKSGVGEAMAAGIALTAAGTPMLASPFEPVRARGAALLAKAALEFAQAAATAGVNQQNQKAADAVGKAAASTGEQLKSPEDVKKEAAAAVNSPELQKALGEAGINSDDFVNKLVNGELTDPASVLAAAGDKSDISPDLLAKGMADAAISGGPETKGKEELPHITFNDGATGVAPQGGTTGAGGLGALGQPGDGKNDKSKDIGNLSTPAGLLAQAQLMAQRAMDLAKASGMDKLMNLNLADLTEKYLAMLSKKQGGAAAKALNDIRLLDLGIRQLRPKQNLFHVAHKSYKDFSRWRSRNKPKRVAQATVH